MIQCWIDDSIWNQLSKNSMKGALSSQSNLKKNHEAGLNFWNWKTDYH